MAVKLTQSLPRKEKPYRHNPFQFKSGKVALFKKKKEKSFSDVS